MKKVDKDSRIPLYYQIMDILIEYIKDNMKEGEQLPSERYICEKYEVSRSTTRQALLELEREGYIYKVQGKGTFVSPERFKQDLLKFYSFTEEMKKAGKEPISKVLSFEIIGCDEKISNKMKVKEDEMIYKVKRLRLADNVPMIIETSYIPYDRFPGITKNDLETQAMYDIFTKKFNANFTMAEEYFEPVITNSYEASKLYVEEGTPGLKIERYTYEGNNIIEYTVSIARGDKFRYHVTLKK